MIVVVVVGADGLVLRRNPLYGVELPWARLKLPDAKPIIAGMFETKKKRKKPKFL